MNLKRLFSVPGIMLVVIMAIGAWAILRYAESWELMSCWLLCGSPFLYLMVRK